MTFSTTENRTFSAQLVWMMGFTMLTAIGAQIEIPSTPVPFTLQTFFVLLSGVILGKRNGAISQLLYLSAGIIGAPVFSGFGFGVAKIVGPTGGYLLSFPVVAFIVGLLVERLRTYWGVSASMLFGMFVLFAFGTLHLSAFYLHNFSESVEKGFLIFSIWDIAKLFSAAGIAHAILRHRDTQIKE